LVGSGGSFLKTLTKNTMNSVTQKAIKDYVFDWNKNDISNYREFTAKDSPQYTGGALTGSDNNKIDATRRYEKQLNELFWRLENSNKKEFYFISDKRGSLFIALSHLEGDKFQEILAQKTALIEALENKNLEAVDEVLDVIFLSDFNKEIKLGLIRESFAHSYKNPESEYPSHYLLGANEDQILDTIISALRPAEDHQLIKDNMKNALNGKMDDLVKREEESFTPTVTFGLNTSQYEFDSTPSNIRGDNRQLEFSSDEEEDEEMVDETTKFIRDLIFLLDIFDSNGFKVKLKEISNSTLDKNQRFKIIHDVIFDKQGDFLANKKFDISTEQGTFQAFNFVCRDYFNDKKMADDFIATICEKRRDGSNLVKKVKTAEQCCGALEANINDIINKYLIESKDQGENIATFIKLIDDVSSLENSEQIAALAGVDVLCSVLELNGEENEPKYTVGQLDVIFDKLGIKDKSVIGKLFKKERSNPTKNISGRTSPKTFLPLENSRERSESLSSGASGGMGI
jgi:hypothetical protein